MYKEAKPSTDPVQQKLREDKKSWNKEVSALIDDLINFKKMMNGQPSKFFKEKSFIKNPIPADPLTIIGVLANDFQDIARKGNDIIQQQLNYSKTRKQKQLKQNSGLAPVTNTPNLNLSKELSLAIEQYQLFALGSNKASRFFSRILNPGLGSNPKARIRKYRMSLLEALARLDKDFDTFRATIVKSSAESIFTATKLFSRLESNWKFIVDGITTYETNLPPKIISKPDPAIINLVVNQNVVPAKLTIDDIIEDYKNYGSNFINIDLKTLHSLLTAYTNSSDAEKINMSQSIQDEYKNVIQAANAKHGTSGSTLAQIWTTKVAKVLLNYNLNKYAEKFFQKWLGKTIHKINPFDKTSAFRLDMFNLGKEIQDNLDTMMDSLEKEMDIDLLKKIVIEIDNKFIVLRKLVITLQTTIKGQGFEKSFVKLLDDDQITDFPVNLDDKQKERLENYITQRRMRDLARIQYRELQ